MKCGTIETTAILSGLLAFIALPSLVAAFGIRQSGPLFDAKHGVKMGVPSGGCDDGQTNLDVDWDGDSVNYTCFTPSRPLYPNFEVASQLFCDEVPPGFVPIHHCMSEKLQYSDLLPTYGDHRPLWAKYGEYRFVPRERWLHNVEHGAVIMLYDPCVLDTMVEKLKGIVKKCLPKHVITSTTFLSVERPLALIAWGCRLEMSYIDEQEVVQFIRKYGMKGPEGNMPSDGQYDYMMVESVADVNHINNLNSGRLCPTY